MESPQAFALEDGAYDRMMAELQAGKRYVFSYYGACPHHNPEDCTCVKNVNFLHEGKIMRVVNGTRHIVHKASDYLATLEDTDQVITYVNMKTSVFLVRGEQQYREYLHEMITSTPAHLMRFKVALVYDTWDDGTLRPDHECTARSSDGTVTREQALALVDVAIQVLVSASA
jgi:hypothetical protein